VSAPASVSLASAPLVSAQRACARVSQPCLPACACQPSACLLAVRSLTCLHSCCCSSCCLSTSITTAGPSGLVVDTLHRSLSRLLACLLVRALPACPSASLPGFVGSHLPRQRIHSHHRIPTGTPAPIQSVTQSVSCTKTYLSSSTDRPTDQAATSAPPRQSHQLARAGPDISYLSPPRRL
jgi:hypothetical protein